MECLVLGLKRYDFVNSDGERVRGLKVTYLDDFMEESKHVRGKLPLTVSSGFEMFNSFDVLPGYYDLSFSQRPDSKGRPVLFLTDAKFIRGVEL